MAQGRVQVQTGVATAKLVAGQSGGQERQGRGVRDLLAEEVGEG